jgi:hypothetical protein
MPSRTAAVWSPIVAVLLLPGVAAAESYLPPRNILDPADLKDRDKIDESVPFVYLEPHDVCFDVARPLTVTVYAVNRSGKPVTIDWPAVVESLVLEPVGPGSVRPARGKTRVEAEEVGAQGVGHVTIDLSERFEVSGPSVYRLSSSRPLADGRVHVAPPVRFLVEDQTAITKLAAGLDPGPAREAFVALLKANPLFTTGGEPKSYGWDLQVWGKHSEMGKSQWDEPIKHANQRWRDGITLLTGPDAPTSHAKALTALMDRLLLVSDNFRSLPNPQFIELLDRRVAENRPRAERERLLLKWVRSQDPNAVSRSLGGLMMLKSLAALDAFFAIADGPDRQLAEQAISSLSSFDPDPRITQFLRRKMTDDDPGLALEAAIVTCYVSDWSGMPVMLRCARSKDRELRLKAIGQFCGVRFRRYADKIVPILLDELKQPLSDDHLERAVDSLGTYPEDRVVAAVTPLLKHKNPQVAYRARLSLDTIQRDRDRDQRK